MVTPKRRLSTPGRFLRNEDGQSLVEFAITAPLLIALLAGIINFGLIIFTYLNMNITVQEAARLAGLGQSDCVVGQYIWDHVTVQGADKLVLDSCPADNTTSDNKSLIVTITPDESTRASGDYVTVTIQYAMASLTPVFDQLLSAVNLTTTATVRVE